MSSHTCTCVWLRCTRLTALVRDTCWYLGLSSWGDLREREDGVIITADTVQHRRLLVAATVCNCGVARRWWHGALPTACFGSRALLGRSPHMQYGRSRCRWALCRVTHASSRWGPRTAHFGWSWGRALRIARHSLGTFDAAWPDFDACPNAFLTPVSGCQLSPSNDSRWEVWPRRV